MSLLKSTFETLLGSPLLLLLYVIAIWVMVLGVTRVIHKQPELVNAGADKDEIKKNNSIGSIYLWISLLIISTPTLFIMENSLIIDGFYLLDFYGNIKNQNMAHYTVYLLSFVGIGMLVYYAFIAPRNAIK